MRSVTPEVASSSLVVPAIVKKKPASFEVGFFVISPPFFKGRRGGIYVSWYALLRSGKAALYKMAQLFYPGFETFRHGSLSTLARVYRLFEATI